jgi:hypothetical protein
MVFNLIFKELVLPFEWQKNIPELKSIDKNLLLQGIGAIRETGDKGDWKVIVDENLGLITEVSMEGLNGASSSIRLDTSFFSRNGVYIAEHIETLPTAVRYLEICSRYLQKVSEFTINYPYIAKGGDGYCSESLIIPEKLQKREHTVSKEDFLFTAHRITGQFGTELVHVLWDEQGLLREVSIDRDACTYHLNRYDYAYYPHNVDTLYQAATLHAIVGTWINELLKTS